MKTVITYGTYDLLHYGHIRLLERAKALGDYLIVGITSDDYDRSRGKINIQQSLMERVEAVEQTGLADQIIIEEYVGQKIDDIKRYNVDVFAIGSDWKGKFDYLDEYCKVVYLERTKGVSSSEIRSKLANVKIGFVSDGNARVMEKNRKECEAVNGAEVAGVFTNEKAVRQKMKEQGVRLVENYDALLEICDAVYICSYPEEHYHHIKRALEKGKHVLCESPISLNKEQASELFEYASRNELILQEAIKTAYCTAYNRLLLLIKSGKIGTVLSVDTTSTDLSGLYKTEEFAIHGWNSICKWGPTGMLPVFQILGDTYNDVNITTMISDMENMNDIFTRISFTYPKAVANVTVGMGAKSEGEMIVSGTKGYIYVPAPWWKTDYFEVRYEKPEYNERFFYQLEGEGLRYQLVAFVKAISTGKLPGYIESSVSESIAGVLENFYCNNKVNIIDVSQ